MGLRYESRRTLLVEMGSRVSVDIASPEKVAADAERRIANAARNMSTLKMSESVDIPNVPVITLGLCGLLSCGVLWQRRGSLQSFRRIGEQTSTAVICCGLMALYAVLLSFGVPGFRWATIGFVLCLGFVLSGFRLAKLPAVGVLAQVLGLGLYFLFTNVLVIDLP